MLNPATIWVYRLFSEAIVLYDNSEVNIVEYNDRKVY